MNWENQTNNQGIDTKLVVYFTPEQPEKSKTYLAFAGEEKKETAIANMTRRLLLREIMGKYKVAIFYHKGVEVERWKNGIKIS
jgi:hypothetical protein